MNEAEALTLARLAKASCPQQAFDEYTPDAWFGILHDLRFEDAKAGLFAVVKVKPFVSPAEIRAEVRKIRDKRIADFGNFDVPANLPEAEYREHLSITRKRIADGEVSSAAELEWSGPTQDVTGLRELVTSFGRIGDLHPTPRPDVPIAAPESARAYSTIPKSAQSPTERPQGAQIEETEKV